MMDFYQIKTRSTKRGVIEIYPDFKIGCTKDLMVRGKSFYAIWDKDKGVWSTNEFDVPRLVDADLRQYLEDRRHEFGSNVEIKLMSNYSSRIWIDYKSFVSSMSDTYHALDNKVTFLNDDVKRSDYVSKYVPYSLEEGPIDAYDELMSTLYDPSERDKLEWAIGALVTGEARYIQKFIVLYGEAGAGKSTILNIIQKLFEGYYTAFEAKALTSNNNAFATEVFKNNPLVAIQHDGDLSKIEDNTKLNSIVSHEEMSMNEKYKASYVSRANCFLFMGTNRPVKITDAKSGIIRRLIDVKPSGRILPPSRYYKLIKQIDFELGAIAYHCKEVYKTLGKNHYAAYRPLSMMMETDVFFNFIEEYYLTFKKQNGTTLSQAYAMYKEYADETLLAYKLPKYKFREELKSYFKDFKPMTRWDGKVSRNVYLEFLDNKFVSELEAAESQTCKTMALNKTESLFDRVAEDYLAQYATSNGTPTKKWDKVKTTLEELDTSKLHYVKVPENHIVIDFDLKDVNGDKSLKLNLEAASKWPPTYAELSKSGKGVHLHYIYDGDVNKLSRIYDDEIEVKVFTGKSSLRRLLTKCNDLPIRKINSGLPLKGDGKTMINFEAVQSEKGLRSLIKRNLAKEIHSGTKPSVDFIHKILEDAYNSGLGYDVTDMRPAILAFANNSSNQADYCIKLVGEMKFKSEDISISSETYASEDLVFFDVEVFPNLFVVVWKPDGKDPVKMINPTSKDIELLLNLKLVGFNCRRYDNHIIYARYLGYTNEQLFQLSQRIIGGSKNAMFGEAYNLSYTDVYDFSSKKQSLKKFELELGLTHKELGLKWEEPVPEELWTEVADYCVIDVMATEATFHARKQDFIARQILADLSGLTVNDSTQSHTARIIFGKDRKPYEKFIYTDLSEQFPGYTFEQGVSMYRGEKTGEGGYVYAEPGIHCNVALLDVASMHPNSLINLDMFGPYTDNFKQLLDARIAIKHKDYDTAKGMLNGILSKYLTTEDESDALSYALKIVINIVYGLTSAKFENKFKDPRNADNIVAKRGALFMIDLKHAVQEKGFTVAHIKTDSIKIPNATPEIIQFVMDFGKEYGYTFEHEATYDRMFLANDAVYIAKYKDGKHAGEWTATGAQFAQPYVFKTLFSKEPIVFEDLCETKTVSTALYLDFNEGLGEDEHNYHFIGKAGSFVPLKPGEGGGVLLREKDEKYNAASGTKGYRWIESDVAKALGKEIDKSYFIRDVDKAVDTISKYGDFEAFVSNMPCEDIPIRELMPCNNVKYLSCFDCPNLEIDEHHADCKLGHYINDVIAKGEEYYDG